MQRRGFLGRLVSVATALLGVVTAAKASGPSKPTNGLPAVRFDIKTETLWVYNPALRKWAKDRMAYHP